MSTQSCKCKTSLVRTLLLCLKPSEKKEIRSPLIRWRLQLEAHTGADRMDTEAGTDITSIVTLVYDLQPAMFLHQMTRNGGQGWLA